MTTRIGAAIAAGSLTVGILVGAAGIVVARDATSTDLAEHMGGMTGAAGSMGGMTGMTSMMGDGHTAQMAQMMTMMGGAGSSMMPDASMAPEDHLKHHTSPTPAATR